MKLTITGQIDGKSVPITIPIEKVIEAFWPYATKPSALSVSTELDADGISANFMLGQETKDSYPGIWLTSKNSNTSNSLSPTRIAGKVNTRSSWMLFPAAKMCGLSSKGTASSSVFSTLCPA